MSISSAPPIRASGRLTPAASRNGAPTSPTTSAALDLYRDEGLFDRARALEPVFADAVHGLKGAPHVVDIRTIGLAAGIDLAPVDGAPGLRGARAFDAAFFNEDLVIRAVGDTLVLAPSLIAAEADIAAITERVARLLKGLR